MLWVEMSVETSPLFECLVLGRQDANWSLLSRSSDFSELASVCGFSQRLGHFWEASRRPNTNVKRRGRFLLKDFRENCSHWVNTVHVACFAGHPLAWKMKHRLRMALLPLGVWVAVPAPSRGCGRLAGAGPGLCALLSTCALKTQLLELALGRPGLMLWWTVEWLDDEKFQLNWKFSWENSIHSGWMLKTGD